VVDGIPCLLSSWKLRVCPSGTLATPGPVPVPVHTAAISATASKLFLFMSFTSCSVFCCRAFVSNAPPALALKRCLDGTAQVCNPESVFRNVEQLVLKYGIGAVMHISWISQYLVADEPTANPDSVSSRQIPELFRELNGIWGRRS